MNLKTTLPIAEVNLFLPRRLGWSALCLIAASALLACGDDSAPGGTGASGGAGGSGGSGATGAGGSGASGGQASSTSSSTASSTSGTSSSSSSSTGGGAEIALFNVKDETTCVSQFGVVPVLPSEAGHYATTRLVPPSYPFEVTRVSYFLAQPTGVPQCADQSFAHQVQIYVDTKKKPPNAPSSDGKLVETILVPAGSATAHKVELTLTSPVTLATDESLFIAVQLVGAGSQSLCIGACADSAAISKVDFWSNAAAEPFSYADMVVDFGFTYNFSTRAYGTEQ